MNVINSTNRMAVHNHSLNQECIVLFRNGVERVLSNWTALRLAVDHGTGGPKSRELAADLVQFVGDTICEGGNVEAEDISDILVEVMDTQFDTLLEDNSPDEIASLLCKLYNLCLQENVNELKKEIENLPVSRANESQEWNSVQCQTEQNTKVPSLAPVLEMDSGNQEMADVTELQEEAEPGWTQVTRRKRVP